MYRYIMAIALSFIASLSLLFPLSLSFHYFVLYLIYGTIFPMIVAQAWGFRYVLVGVLVSGFAFFPLYTWPHDGLACLIDIVRINGWLLLHGWIATKYRDKTFVYLVHLRAQLSFVIVTALCFFVLRPLAMQYNADIWPWPAQQSVAFSAIMFMFLKNIFLETFIVMVASLLLRLPMMRRLFQLPILPLQQRNRRILFWTLLVSAGLAFIQVALVEMMTRQDVTLTWVSDPLFSTRVMALMTVVFAVIIGYVLVYLLERQFIAEQKVHHYAYYDTETSLKNSYYFHEDMHHEVRYGAGRTFSLAYVHFQDIDQIENLFGTQTALDYIQQLVTRLEAYVAREHIYRLDKQTLVVRIPQLTVKIQEALRQLEHPVIAQQYQLFNGIYVGLAHYPTHAKTGQDLVKAAQIAMFHAKEKHVRIFEYNERIAHHYHREKLLEHKLRQALEQQRFSLHFQPIVHIETGRIVKFEALVRWNDAEEGFISPAVFIPIAERSGVIVELGYWILAEALRFLRTVHEEGHDEMAISVNVSTLQMLQDDFARTVQRLIEESGVPFAAVHLEMTESVLVHSLDFIRRQLQLLKHLGIQMALDDFGTGYSSLQYLKQLPFDTLKVDQSFVRQLKDETDREYLRQIINIGRIMSLEVVVEGIETEEQVSLIAAYDCSFAQGYLYSKPVPADEARALLGQ